MTEQEAFEWLLQCVKEFEGGTFEGPPDLSESEKGNLRSVGKALWVSPKHGYKIMAHAYAALFGIPRFIGEAHKRQPGRFSGGILFHAIQNTASNLWQTFAFDFDEQGNLIHRDIIPLTGVLHIIHGPRPIPSGPLRNRISDLAIAFFAYQAIRAVEFVSEQEGRGSKELFEAHYRHLAKVIQRSGYHFPNDRQRIEALCREVDRHLARDDPECTACWKNLFQAADRLGIPLTVTGIRNFLHPLMPNEAALFGRVMGTNHLR